MTSGKDTQGQFLLVPEPDKGNGGVMMERKCGSRIWNCTFYVFFLFTYPAKELKIPYQHLPQGVVHLRQCFLPGE